MQKYHNQVYHIVQIPEQNCAEAVHIYGKETQKEQSFVEI